MPRRKPLSPNQFNLEFSTTPKYMFSKGPDDPKVHLIEAYATPEAYKDRRLGIVSPKLGQMQWDAQKGHIISIQVNEAITRRGLGTAMWHEGHRIASETPGIIAPRHSQVRTVSGELWARRVGGDVPPNRAVRAQQLAEGLIKRYPNRGWMSQYERLNPMMHDSEEHLDEYDEKSNGWRDAGF